MTKPASSLLVAAGLALALAACKPSLLPGTSIEDTSDNRAVIDFVTEYRDAVEARSAAKVLSLVADDYWEDNVDLDLDDVDFADNLDLDGDFDFGEDLDLEEDFHVGDFEIDNDNFDLADFDDFGGYDGSFDVDPSDFGGVDLGDALRGDAQPPSLRAFSHTSALRGSFAAYLARYERWTRHHTGALDGEVWAALRRGDRRWQARDHGGGDWREAVVDLATDPDATGGGAPASAAEDRRRSALREGWSRRPEPTDADNLEALRALGYIE